MTTNRIWLGLIAALSIAACSSSRDSLLNGHGGDGLDGGPGGNAGPCDGASVIICNDGITKACSVTACPPTGGAGGGAGGGGTGGVRACEQGLCVRPYECIRSCGGPIEYTGCCMCEAPLFDNFQNMACGGSSGSGGTSGRGGTGGAAGAGGTGGAAGRGGTGGAAGAVGGAPGGRGGTGGGGGAAGAAGGTGGPVDGGTDARACEMFQCVRPYKCIRACGGPIVTNDCCPCEAPLFDDYNGMACGDGGTGAISYVGCRFIGGNDRVVVAKRDTSRNLCVNVVFVGPGTAPAGLTLPSSYGLESVSVGAASACPTRQVLSTGAGPVTGTATWTSLGNPTIADVDLVVTLPGNDEALIAGNVDVSPACQ